MPKILLKVHIKKWVQREFPSLKIVYLFKFSITTTDKAFLGFFKPILLESLFSNPSILKNRTGSNLSTNRQKNF